MFSCFFISPPKNILPCLLLQVLNTAEKKIKNIVKNSNKFCIFAFYYYTNEKQNPHHIDVVGHPSGMGTT